MVPDGKLIRYDSPESPALTLAASDAIAAYPGTRGAFIYVVNSFKHSSDDAKSGTAYRCRVKDSSNIS